MEIKAIDTIYNDYKFRSRLEARWAIFFDNLKIDWEYEFEGYVLKDGTWYLPDFWLPTFDWGSYCEVKPKGGDFSKAKLFAETTGSLIWFCEGVPDIAVYKTYKFCEDDIEILCCGIPNYDQAYNENRMFAMPCQFSCDNCKTDRPFYLTTEKDIRQFHQSDIVVYDAIRAAKSARFEFDGT